MDKLKLTQEVLASLTTPDDQDAYLNTTVPLVCPTGTAGPPSL
jgi:hypothetical protein